MAMVAGHRRAQSGTERGEGSSSSRVSSAEVRRRMRAWHYGDIEGVELEVIREPEDAQCLDETDGPTLHSSGPDTAVIRPHSNIGREETSTALPGQQEPDSRNILGARLREQQHWGKSRVNFQVPPVVTSRTAGGTEIGLAQGATTAATVDKARQKLVTKASTLQADASTRPAPWMSHPATATLHAAQQDTQRLTLARSRAKQVHSPDHYRVATETIHLPPGTQAWRESSLQDQRNIDLQLLHVTSRGPTEDMTQRLAEQPTGRIAALHKVENKRAGKNKVQLAFQALAIWYKQFSYSTEYNPFLKKYIKDVQSRFGNGTASFFIFVRSILQLNVAIALLWLFFVVIPTLVHPGVKSSEKFLLHHLFDGQGPVASSIMYYGGYTAVANGYRVDMAYLALTLVTIFGSFLVVMHWLAVSLGEGSRSSKQPDRSSLSYATTVLSSWEHSASRNKQAVRNMQLGIKTSLKELLDERKRLMKTRRTTKQERYRYILLRTVGWITAVILTAGSIAGFLFLARETAGDESPATVDNSTNQTIPANAFLSPALRKGTFSIIFVLINALVPTILSKLVLFESYASERTEIMVTLVRVFGVRMSYLYVLIYVTLSESLKAGNSAIGCRGTYFGQEFYKIILLASFLTPFMKVLLHYTYRYWTNERMQMNRPNAVLDLVYLEALIWTATPFCPLLPVLGCVGVLLTFVVYYRIVMDTCMPPERRWTQSLHDPMFTLLLALSSLMVIVPASVYLTTLEVNLGVRDDALPCGPYNSTMSPLEVFYTGVAGILPLAWTFSKTVFLPIAFMLVAFSHFFLIFVLRQKKDRQKLYLDWAEDRHKMSSYLQFVVGCQCRPGDRDLILKGAAGEFFADTPIHRPTVTNGNDVAPTEPSGAETQLGGRMKRPSGMLSPRITKPADLPKVTVQSVAEKATARPVLDGGTAVDTSAV